MIAVLLLAGAAVLELYDFSGITGSAISSPLPEVIVSTDRIVVGTYSIRPSFSVELDYDLNVYDRIEAALSRIYNKCSSESSKESCVNNEVLLYNVEQAAGNSQERLLIGCYEGDQGSFMDFLDYVSNCSSSQTTNCECGHQHISGTTFTLAQSGNDIQITAEVNKQKYSGIVHNARLVAPLSFSSTLNYRMAKGQDGALLAVRKGDIGKTCDEKLYQRKTYTFCYNTGKKLITADAKNKIVEQAHKIRFALEFP